MALTKYKLGELISQRREKFNGNEELPIRGVAREGFISPKQDGADTSIYNVFYKHDFVFNPARMELNSIALNLSFDKAICSSLYEIFYVARIDLVLPEYLNIYIKRDEFARKCWFCAVGSARNYFRVADLSEFDIELPDLPTQQKYVDIYNAMVANQQSYERGLEDLKLVCEGHLDDAKKKHIIPLGQLIESVDSRNSDNLFFKDDVKGITNNKEFAETRADISSVDLSKFKIVQPNQFAYNSRTDGRDMLVLALNKEPSPVIITFNYNVFKIRAAMSNVISAEYLYAYFKRTEFDRRVRFSSWGSSQELLSWENLCDIHVPIPDLQTQQAIAGIMNVYITRKKINDQLKTQIKDICPILIRGSLEDGKQ